MCRTTRCQKDYIEWTRSQKPIPRSPSLTNRALVTTACSPGICLKARWFFLNNKIFTLLFLNFLILLPHLVEKSIILRVKCFDLYQRTATFSLCCLSRWTYSLSASTSKLNDSYLVCALFKVKLVWVWNYMPVSSLELVFNLAFWGKWVEIWLYIIGFYIFYLELLLLWFIYYLYFLKF